MASIPSPTLVEGSFEYAEKRVLEGVRGRAEMVAAGMMARVIVRARRKEMAFLMCAKEEGVDNLSITEISGAAKSLLKNVRKLVDILSLLLCGLLPFGQG